jgi:hypothetical protein
MFTHGGLNDAETGHVRRLRLPAGSSIELAPGTMLGMRAPSQARVPEGVERRALRRRGSTDPTLPAVRSAGDPRTARPDESVLRPAVSAGPMARETASGKEERMTDPWPNHPQRQARHPELGEIDVDGGLVELLERLWDAGASTFSSCQGDGTESAWINFQSPADARILWNALESPTAICTWVAWSEGTLASVPRELFMAHDSDDDVLLLNRRHWRRVPNEWAVEVRFSSDRIPLLIEAMNQTTRREVDR